MFLLVDTFLPIETHEEMMTKTDTIIRALSGDRFTPVSLARKLEAKAILESSSFKKGKSRYSFLLIDEAFRISQEAGKLYQIQGESRKELNGYKDILEVLQEISQMHKEIQFPYPAGGIGYLSFDFFSYCDTIKLTEQNSELNIPEALFLFGNSYVIYDHFTERIYLLGINYKEAEVDLEELLDNIEERINDFDFNFMAPETSHYSAEVIDNENEKKDFMTGVQAIKDEIIKGNLLQCVLSSRLRIKTKLPSLSAYQKMRMNNPSPYMFYLNFDSFQIFGTSPEVHLKEKEGICTVRPIAGTRRRGKDAEEDKALEKELLADEKERAEHLMLLDLGRNDLGRVCKPKTIEVTESNSVEYYSHVMHIVSEVKGELQDCYNGIDALRATFPAGTVSGAPKIQAIKTINRLEKYKREFYAGVIGYFEPGGHLDSCITIRSGIKKDGIIYLQSGAGIVYDSTAEREYEETREKLRAAAKAIGVEV